MSNVNPNHYKVAGRERQGDGLLQDRHRQRFADNQARERFDSRQGPPASAAGPEEAPPAITKAAAVERNTRETGAKARTRTAAPRQPAKGTKTATKRGAKKGVKKAVPASARKSGRTSPKRSAKTAAKPVAKGRSAATGSSRKSSNTSAAAKRAGQRKRSS